jgi:hypothetical protein
MTTLLFAPVETRPVSPATIPETATLAELTRIKQSWIQAARELEYPENIWQVVFWLGSKTRAGMRECQVWQSGDVAIIANEYPLRFLPEKNTNLVQRSFGVWVADGKLHLPQANPIDQIIFSSNLVARWAWQLAGDEVEEVAKELLFLPGHWLNVILAEVTHAHHLAQQQGQDAIEIERRRLLSEMLVGLDV